MIFRGPFGGPPGDQRQPGRQPSQMVAVTAAADSRTNTVVVTGPESVLTVVEDVIKKLDAPLSNVADVKVFRLEYADASNTAQLINEVFGQSRTSSSSRSSRSSSQQSQQVQFGFGGRGGGMMGGMGGQPGGGQTGSSSDITVVASADTRDELRRGQRSARRPWRSLPRSSKNSIRTRRRSAASSSTRSRTPRPPVS